MLVEEAIVLLQRCDPKSELVIRDYSRVGIGPLPYKEINSIGEGFDWDKGKAIISEKLTVPRKDLLKKSL